MCPRGKELIWETGIKELNFEVFPEGCDRGAIFYMEGEKVSLISSHFWFQIFVKEWVLAEVCNL